MCTYTYSINIFLVNVVVVVVVVANNTMTVYVVSCDWSNKLCIYMLYTTSDCLHLCDDDDDDDDNNNNINASKNGKFK